MNIRGQICKAFLWTHRSTKAAVFGFCVIAPLLSGCGTGLSDAHSKDDGPNTNVGPVQLNLQPATISFPNTIVGLSSTPVVLTLTNVSDSPAAIQPSIPTTNLSVLSNSCTAPLTAHSKCSLSVSFSPSSAGAKSGSIEFQNDGGTSLNAQFTGNALLPTLEVSPTSVSFGDVAINTPSQTTQVHVTNISASSLQPIYINASKPFTVASNSCATTLLAQASCDIGLAFLPVAPGSGTGVLTITAAGYTTQVNLSGDTPPGILEIETPSSLTSLSSNNSISLAARLNGVPTSQVVWSTSDTSNGSIDQNGVFTAAAVPVATVEAINATLISNPKLTASLKLTVMPALPQVFNLNPSTISAGTPTLVHLSGVHLDQVAAVLHGGQSLPVSNQKENSLDVTATIPAYFSGPYELVLQPKTLGQKLVSAGTLGLASSTVDLDTAVRFSQQAAFGPTADQIAQIQTRGLSGWIDWQLSVPPYPYASDTGMDYGQYMRNTQNSSYALRQRVSLALREIYAFGYAPECYVAECGHYWEDQIERDAFANVKTLLTDVGLHPMMGSFLSNAKNFDGYPYNFTANQNFAREFMQLMSLGPNLLNEDGSIQTGNDGLPLNTYTEDNIIAMSGALSGWTFSDSSGNPVFWMADGTHPMVAVDGAHNMKAKQILPGLILPAGQDAAHDYAAVINALFQHPNIAPFISKALISHLVTSNPSPAYVARIARVFDDNGKGTRGDLGAVVKAILLDDEARRGDVVSTAGNNDSHLMEPILFVADLFNLVGGCFNDDRIYLYLDPMGQDPLMEPTIFGYFSPTNALPDGHFSPEAQLLSNNAAMQKISFVNNLLKTGIPGVSANLAASPFWQASTKEELLGLFNHLMFHGTMPPAVSQSLSAYIADHPQLTLQQQLPDLIVIVSSSSAFQVIH